MEDCNVTGAGGAGLMLVDCGPEVAILRCTVTGAAKAAVQISAPAQNKTRAAGQNKPEARAADAGAPQNRRAGNGPSQNIPPQNGSSTTGPDKNSCSAENSPQRVQLLHLCHLLSQDIDATQTRRVGAGAAATCPAASVFGLGARLGAFGDGHQVKHHC